MPLPLILELFLVKSKTSLTMFMFIISYQAVWEGVNKKNIVTDMYANGKGRGSIPCLQLKLNIGVCFLLGKKI